MNTHTPSRDSQRDRAIRPRRPLVLVGAARIVGEPFHLYRALGRRRLRVIRLPDQP